MAGVATTADLARLLRQLRRRQARHAGETTLTYRELAAKTGWSRGIIGEYFAGNVLPPTDRFDVLIQLLGATPAEQGWLATIRDRVEEHRRSQPPISSGAASHGRIMQPVPIRLPHRDAQTQAVVQLLAGSGSRLVTLTGPSGAGKTSLALAVATQLIPHFVDGVAVVSLAPVPDPGLVMPAIAKALGLRRRLGTQSWAQILHGYLRTRRMLLVLDHAEHLLPAAPQLATLLATAPGLGMLITSRSPVGLLGEYVYPVTPLATPAAGDTCEQRPDKSSTDGNQRVISPQADGLATMTTTPKEPGNALAKSPGVGSDCVAASRVWNIPARSPVFTGRDKQLTALRAVFQGEENSTTVVQALYGMGGIGKTALAIEYAHRYGAEYKVAWWIPAEEPALVADRLAELAQALSLATVTDPVTAAVARLLGALGEQDRWLLIFDNAVDPTALVPYLPRGSGHVLITSRNPGWQELATPMEVTVFDRHESIALLRRRLPLVTEGEAERIAAALADLPLALTQAASYLADTATSVDHYLTLLAERTAELLTQGVSATHPVSLAASVQIALDRLGAQSPAALVLVSLAAYLGPEPIPLTLFSTHPTQLPNPLTSAAGDSLEFTTLIRLLRQYGLVRVEPTTVLLHRLLAAIVRSQTRQHQDLPTHVVRLLRVTVPADPWENPTVWPVWRQLLAHVLIATDPHRTLNGVEEDVAWLLQRAGEYLQARGEASTARPLLERAGDLRCFLLGDHHPDTLESAGGLSFNLWALGQYEQARQLGEDTFTRCRRVLGEDHPHTLRIAHILASVLRELGQYDQARQLGEDTFTRCRRVLGEDHPDTLRSAHILAAALWELGQYDEAYQLGADTFTRCRRVLGEDHPHTLRSAHILTAAYRGLRQYDQARQLGEDTLTRCRRVLGEDHPDTLRTAHSLAATLRKLEHYEQARQLGEDTLTRCRRALGEDHPDTLRAAHSLAATLAYLAEHKQVCWLEKRTLNVSM